MMIWLLKTFGIYNIYTFIFCNFYIKSMLFIASVKNTLKLLTVIL